MCLRLWLQTWIGNLISPSYKKDLQQGWSCSMEKEMTRLIPLPVWICCFSLLRIWLLCKQRQLHEDKQHGKRSSLLPKNNNRAVLQYKKYAKDGLRKSKIDVRRHKLRHKYAKKNSFGTTYFTTWFINQSSTRNHNNYIHRIEFCNLNIITGPAGP